MAKPEITKSIEIEDLTEEYPFAVKYLADKGIRCIVCGEPIWGTLEEAAKEKGFTDVQIEEFVNELNEKASKENRDQAESNQNIDVKKYNP